MALYILLSCLRTEDMTQQLPATSSIPMLPASTCLASHVFSCPYTHVWCLCAYSWTDTFLWWWGKCRGNESGRHVSYDIQQRPLTKASVSGWHPLVPLASGVLCTPGICTCQVWQTWGYCLNMVLWDALCGSPTVFSRGVVLFCLSWSQGCHLINFMFDFSITIVDFCSLCWHIFLLRST